MRKLLIFLIVIVVVTPMWAQNRPRLDQLGSHYLTVATLPGSPWTGELELINDANPTCLTGGGASKALCRWNGASWDTIGGGGSSGINSSGIGCNAVYNTTTTVSGSCAVLDATQFAGANLCAKIVAAISALPKNGTVPIGTVDARNFIGDQACTSDPFSSTVSTGGQSVKVLLGNYYILTTAAWTLKNGVSLIGFSPSTGTGGTLLDADPTFPINTPMITFGTAGNDNAAQLSGITLSCEGITGVKGIVAVNQNTGSEISYVRTSDCLAGGISLAGVSFSLKNFSVSGSGLGTTAFGVNVSASSQGKIDYGIISDGGNATTVGISAAPGAGLEVRNITESGVATGFSFSNATCGSGSGPLILSNFTITIQGTGPGISIGTCNNDVDIFGISDLTSLSHVLVDNTTGVTLGGSAATNQVSFYSIGAGQSTPQVRSSNPFSFTVATLPNATTGGGFSYRVTDSTAVATEGQACVGGSSNNAIAISNGASWKCF